MAKRDDVMHQHVQPPHLWVSPVNTWQIPSLTLALHSPVPLLRIGQVVKHPGSSVMLLFCCRAMSPIELSAALPALRALWYGNRNCREAAQKMCRGDPPRSSSLLAACRMQRREAAEERGGDFFFPPLYGSSSWRLSSSLQAWLSLLRSLSRGGGGWRRKREGEAAGVWCIMERLKAAHLLLPFSF